MGSSTQAASWRVWLVQPAFAQSLLRDCPRCLTLYRDRITQAVAHILDEVEHLSEAERRELRHAIVERVPMSGDLTDDDFAALAAASFRALDDEETSPRA